MVVGTPLLSRIASAKETHSHFRCGRIAMRPYGFTVPRRRIFGGTGAIAMPRHPFAQAGLPLSKTPENTNWLPLGDQSGVRPCSASSL